MSKPMSPATIAVVKATEPALVVHGLAITSRMYERLFENGEIAALFAAATSDRSEQPKCLAGAILVFARNVDRLETLAPAVEAIAARHVAASVRPEHYAPVADALLPAITDVPGDAVDDDALAACGDAYWFLADVLVARETADTVR